MSNIGLTFGQPFWVKKSVRTIYNLASRRTSEMDGRLTVKIGTPAPRKQADIAVVSLTHAAQQPVTDIHTAHVLFDYRRNGL